MRAGDGVANWFATPWVASRYAAGRPDVHTGIAARVRARVAPGGPLARALDVGCGTGLSTRALRGVASSVVGLDPSAPMLEEARRAGGPDYVRARAEALPIADGSLDLLSIGCAWHWCRPGAFLASVARALRPGGWLVVYDSDFRGAADDPGLLLWLREHYWAHLARVARHAYFEPRRLRHESLEPVAREELEQVVPMTRERVRTLITSQASTAGNVERGVLRLEDAEARLEAGLARFLPAREARPMRFVAVLDFVRRRA